MTPSRLLRSFRLLLLGCAVAALALGLSTGLSYGGLSANLSNPTGTTGTGTLLYTHTYNSTSCTSLTGTTIAATSSFACSGTLAPASSPTSATASVSGPQDSIAYAGSLTAATVTQKVSAGGCAPVQLANTAAAANPLLVRYGTTFSPAAGPMANTAGSIKLDGANPGGYATSVVGGQLAVPGLLATATYGYGIWFKAASGSAGGPLFGVGDSPANASTVSDRILTLTGAGLLSFIAKTGSALTTAGTDYRDGAWHFAYVRMTLSTSVLNVVTVGASIYVDGAATAVATSTALATAPTVYTGYWHVGQSPIGGSPAYFAGSLSDFVDFTTSPAPGAPAPTDLAGQAAFNSWSSAAGGRWPLNDSGTTTFTGTYPTGKSNPCGHVNLGWTFANPAGCGSAGASSTAACPDPPSSTLTAFAAAGPSTIAGPAPGSTQTATVKLSRTAAYDTTFDPGLRLYAPLSFTASAGGWVNTFTWADASSSFTA